MGTYPEGRFACVLCGHDVALHNLDVGCPACSCAATPGEAMHNPHVKKPYEGPILRITQTISHYTTRLPYGAPLGYKLVGVDVAKIKAKADLERKAIQIADTVAGGRSIAGHSGIQANTRKIAHGAALRAARIALGLPATEPYVWDAEAARAKRSQEIEYGPDEHGDD